MVKKFQFNNIHEDEQAELMMKFDDEYLFENICHDHALIYIEKYGRLNEFIQGNIQCSCEKYIIKFKADEFMTKLEIQIIS